MLQWNLNQNTLQSDRTGEGLQGDNLGGRHPERTLLCPLATLSHYDVFHKDRKRGEPRLIPERDAAGGDMWSL
ncbi:hypothetical protein INR49_006054 [Caranx melampygus]|nr:hypothetical protein INR49_006054 [Caranx melampygus]